MTHTRYKLSEAEFFLKGMIENQAENQAELDVLGYYFSAFLCAFRSVTFIMQNEFTDSNFESWYNKKQNIMENDGKMKLLKILRNLTLKRHYAKITKRIDVIAPVGVVSAQAILPHVTIDGVPLPSAYNDNDNIQHELSHLEQQAQPTIPESEITIRWTINKESFDFDNESKKEIAKIPNIDEILEMDVITICKECVSVLSGIVSECEGMFVMS
jgi:hypothetical protein